LPAYEEVYKKIYYDDLTGLLNRRGFMQELEHLKGVRSEGEPDQLLAICILDVDRFKDVNDKYGHEVGDMTLIEVADIISTCMREGDIVARWGGDEFAISMLLHHNFEDTTYANVAKWLDLEIQKRLKKAIEVGGENEPLKLIGVSLGVAICRLSQLDDLSVFIDTADSRMYGKKHEGRPVPASGRRVAAKAGKAAVGSSRRASDEPVTLT
jgi:diguanylate cyclase (GGDEF)-like protein